MKDTKTQKPEKIETKAEIELACLWCEEAQEALGGHIAIWPDSFNPIRRISMMWRAGQITQNEEDRCDGPLLQKLEARCADHINAQVEEFAPAIHVAVVAAKAAKGLLGEQASSTRDLEEGGGAADASNTGGLNESERNLVMEHDKKVLGARRAAQMARVRQERKELQALIDRAAHIESTLKRSCTMHAVHAQEHFREQALSALEWAHAKSDLHPPYVLPGTLEELPQLFSEKEEDNHAVA